MARKIPTFPNPNDTNNPYRDAYAWLSGLSLDLTTGQGQFILSVHPNEAAWQDRPVGQITIALGQVLGPGGGWEPPVTGPTLAVLMEDPEFAAAFTVIGDKLYAFADLHPLLAGAVEV